MISVDSILRLIAYGASVMATLRAGSRVLYLSEHAAIGIVDGPLIQPPSRNVTSNETDSTTAIPDRPTLYEISEAFRHCVRLSLFPQDYEGVRRDVQRHVEGGDEDDSTEPYYMSPFQYRSSQVRRDEGDSAEENERGVNQGEESEMATNTKGADSSQRFPMSLRTFVPTITWGTNHVSARRQIEWMKKSILDSPNIVSSWMKSLYFHGRENEIDLEDESEEIYGKTVHIPVSLWERKIQPIRLENSFCSL